MSDSTHFQPMQFAMMHATRYRHADPGELLERRLSGRLKQTCKPGMEALISWLWRLDAKR
jgi:hypothetical protein